MRDDGVLYICIYGLCLFLSDASIAHVLCLPVDAFELPVIRF